MSAIYYTGIGSRETPLYIKNLMTEIALHMNRYNWILRSGGADGADKAFELGAKNLKQVYLPFKNFNKNNSPLYLGSPQLDTRAMRLSKKVWAKRFRDGSVMCPWSYLRQSTKKFMIRNMYQVFGAGLDCPSRVVICWTKYGRVSGGTGQTIYAVEMTKIAQEKKPQEKRKLVPQLINLYWYESVKFIKNMLRQQIDPNNIWPGR